MKKNGFSLIELLAVILILGVVSSIGVIKSIEMSNDEKKKEFDNLKEIIEENAKLLVSENDDLYKGIASKTTTELRRELIVYKRQLSFFPLWKSKSQQVKKNSTNKYKKK